MAGARVLAQRLADGLVLGLAVCRDLARVCREEARGACSSLRFLGEVEVHPPDEVPGRAQPLEEFLERGPRFGMLG